MDPQLKQRLIGAVTLLLLGVLLIPLILDGPPPGSPYAVNKPDTQVLGTQPRKIPSQPPQSVFRAPPPMVQVPSATPPVPSQVQKPRESRHSKPADKPGFNEALAK